MKPDNVKKSDFPLANVGYDRDSVDAHLTAVAASLAALEAQIASLEVERGAVRRQASKSSEPPKQEHSSPRTEDEVSARLVATRMALEGADRDEIRLKLSEGYELADLDALLDDVIERVV